jgi:hypothetical protein
MVRGRRPTARAMAQSNSHLYLCLKVIIYETEKKICNIQSVKHVGFSVLSGSGTNQRIASVWVCLSVSIIEILNTVREPMNVLPTCRIITSHQRYIAQTYFLSLAIQYTALTVLQSSADVACLYVLHQNNIMGGDNCKIRTCTFFTLCNMLLIQDI